MNATRGVSQRTGTAGLTLVYLVYLTAHTGPQGPLGDEIDGGSGRLSRVFIQGTPCTRESTRNFPVCLAGRSTLSAWPTYPDHAQALQVRVQRGHSEARVLLTHLGAAICIVIPIEIHRQRDDRREAVLGQVEQRLQAAVGVECGKFGGDANEGDAVSGATVLPTDKRYFASNRPTPLVPPMINGTPESFMCLLLLTVCA